MKKDQITSNQRASHMKYKFHTAIANNKKNCVRRPNLKQKVQINIYALRLRSLGTWLVGMDGFSWNAPLEVRVVVSCIVGPGPTLDS